ncbi:MAG: bifunctional folylpolyglutamate synthase/dihydrofolate synthase [Bacteroidales bacterium]|nr:bifunctional folylpolyglutamate synthase/dihydrofolate synthase [Bacteroidales bacterium]
MVYSEILHYLYSQFPSFQHVGQSAYVPSLQNIRDLLTLLGNPEKEIACVHVAGTNGKGSTSHFIASILQEAGYRVGLYTSPHLVDFRERIRVDGKNVTAQFINALLIKHSKEIERLKPSMFEVSTAMAFAYFRHKNVDVAVIEVGLGGRLDSTNVITPKLSVITNIGYDHTQILGDTLAKIAREKAGIIKPNIPVVVGEFHPETAPVFEAVAKENGSRILFASKEFIVRSESNWFDTFSILNAEQKSIFQAHSGLHGAYQAKNIATVYAAIQELRKTYTIPVAAIKRGYKNVVANTNLIGRWQIISQKPLTICDTGHNYDGISYTMPQLQSLGKKDIRIVWGMVGDKDIDTIITLLPDNATYYLCMPNIERAMPMERLESFFAKKNHSVHSSVMKAYRAAIQNVTDETVVFVGGSSYVVAEFLSKKSS